MVAKTDCGEKPKTIAGKKVSKPLMEKKRRARINKCLDQLKSLLESYYSTSIRKRKLEKADILELTVNHLRNLQNVQSCSVAASEFSDYQNGFRRCMANVDRYLLMADNLNGSDCWMLSQLSSKLWRSRGREKEFSTTDSGPSRAETQAGDRRLDPEAPEARKTGESKALETSNASTSGFLPSEDAQQLSRNEQVITETAQNTHDESDKKSQSVSHTNEGANIPHMWRPW